MEQAQLVELVKAAVQAHETKPEVTVAKHDEASNTVILRVKVDGATWWVTVYKQRAKA